MDPNTMASFDDEHRHSSFSAKICRICSDEVKEAENGQTFVACHVCAFPVCKPCYDYERSSGNKCCPQCNTPYKRHKDDDEENNNGPVDSDDELNIKNRKDASSIHQNFAYGSENGDYNSKQPWRQNGRAFSSTGSVLGKEFEVERDGATDAEWKDRVDKWKARQEKRGLLVKAEQTKDQDSQSDEEEYLDADARQPLWRKIPISSSKISPYRIVIVLRLIILVFFFRFRILTPAKDAYPLWLISVICEIWFALSWILDQFPKWCPINRETYLDRLSMRFERDGEKNKLAPVDVFVSTVDPLKEPPIITANTILSILAVDYPVSKVSCYVSDDGASMLLFDTLSETSEFARRWVPFCKKYNVEPRAPEFYFSEKIDYLKDKVQTTFVKDRRAMKREYEEFKVRINSLVAKAQKKPEEGWVMQDGTPWPGNNTRDHPGMIQVYLGKEGAYDIDGNELPRLVYVSREKRPGYAHHKKAGAMNAMINMRGLDGIQGPVYVGTGCVFNRPALYGYEPPVSEKRKKMTCDCWPSWLSCCCGGGSRHKPKSEDTKKKSGIKRLLSGLRRKKKTSSATTTTMSYSRKRSTEAIFDLEDIEEGLEGYDELDKSSLMSQKNFEKRFGMSPVFIASTLMEKGGLPEATNTSSLIKEAIHVISCGYEEKTEWGKEIGWIYGSVTEDILTGFKMHCRGWKSVYCMPKRPAFKGSAPINLSDRLHQVLRWALGSVEIFFSRHCPLWYAWGGKLKILERLAYINTIVYPFTSIPLLAYCTIPAVCLLTGKFIIPTINNFASIWFLALFLSIIATAILELRWSGVSITDLWRNEQFWVIGGVSAHLFAVFQGLLKVLFGVDTNFTVTSKGASDEADEFGDLYLFKWTTLLIPPTTLIILNMVGVVAGVSDAINNGYGSWGPLFGKLFFAFWVIVHLYPFLKGLMGRQNRTPTIVVLWSILLASIFSLVWVRIDPFLAKQTGPLLKQCGVDC
ncbi:unnamed protein product [Eruca vesicaria subsp. sativa]|uniref:Cellulose synthase n=1 Tax=Eruca vesicaria subsp. sativa TaxID=29727 RepID=A0ABC8JDE9_ERUVS|nr:unnamed protein product [Eruca vesicaria subsp. sativa]